MEQKMTINKGYGTTTKQFLSASRLTTMMLACLLIFGFTSCSRSEEVESISNGIVGTWVSDKSYFTFHSDGTGMYDSGMEVWGDFKYTTQTSDNGGSVYIKIAYVNRKYQSVWRDELSGSYSNTQRKLWIKEKTFIKK